MSDWKTSKWQFCVQFKYYVDIILNYYVRNVTPLIFSRFDQFLTMVNLFGQTSFYWFTGVKWSIIERMLHEQICLHEIICPQIHSA